MEGYYATSLKRLDKMKIIKISIHGIDPAYAKAVTASNGNKYYCLTHGQEGRGRWQVRLPLSIKDFQPVTDELPLDGEFSLIDLKKTDLKGNPLFLLVRGKSDGKYLVLWDLDPGYRGSATYEVRGQARILALGQEAQGIAGRMGGADCPVVLVEGPCQLTWHRTGRLYGESADWIAIYDGVEWTVSTPETCLLEQAAFTYAT